MMIELDGWELALWAVSGYIAIVTLVRLMHRRRDTLIDHIAEQAQSEKRKRKSANRKAAQAPKPRDRQQRKDAA